MSVRETKVPAIPAIRDDNVKEVLAAIKSTLEVREGTIGDPLDQLVTMRELVALNLGETGVAGATTQSGTTLPIGPVLVAPSNGYNPATDFTTPAQPSSLRASGGFSAVYLEWDGAAFKNPGYTEIWRSQYDVLGGAVMVGTTVANVYADPVNENTTYYYWIRFVSVAGIVGPYNSTSGTPATTALNVTALLPALQAEITKSALFTELGTRISVTETGISTLQQTTATSAQQITTLSSVVGKNQSAIQIQAKVSDGLSAQYTVKIDVNGHVSGFGLASSAVNGTPTSAFIVRADRFAITGANDSSDPLGTLNPTNVPFVVLTTPTVIGGVTYPAGVWIKTAFIADATITSAKISDLTATKITTGNLTAAIGITTGYISGGVNVGGIYPPGSFNFGTGFFLGNYGSAYQFYVGSYANNMLWDGTQLSIKGTIAATNATFRGLTVTDANGNILLGSGQIAGQYISGLTSGQVSGLGGLATQNSVFIGSTVKFPDGTTMNTGDFVNNLSKITAGNISTFIADAAIGNAYIGNLSAAKITTGTMAADRIGAGSIQVGQYIQSSNYVTGSSGWKIDGSGNAEMNGLTVRSGQITGALMPIQQMSHGYGAGMHFDWNNNDAPNGTITGSPYSNSPVYYSGSWWAIMWVGTMPAPATAAHKIAGVVTVSASNQSGSRSSDLVVAVLANASQSGSNVTGDLMGYGVQSGPYNFTVTTAGASGGTYGTAVTLAILVGGFNVNDNITSSDAFFWGVR